MLYEPLAQLLDVHRLEIARTAAQEAHSSEASSYRNRDVSLLTTRIGVTLDKIAHYARSGDPNEYRDYMAELAKKRLTEDYTVEELVAVFRIIINSINKVIERELPGLRFEKDRARYARRLEGIHGLGQSAIVATQMRQNGTKDLN